MDTLVALPLVVRLSAFLLLNVALVYWTRVVSGSFHVGFPRLLVSTPVFLSTFVAPRLFDPSRTEELILYDYVVVSYLWLVNWKIVGLAFDRGPLAGHVDKSRTPAMVFGVLLLLPVNIRGELGSRRTGNMNKKGQEVDVRKASKGTTHYLFWATVKGCLCIILACISIKAWESIPFVRDMALVWVLFFMVSLIMDMLASILITTLNVELMPHFDQPWRAKSLSEFWGNRWNLVVGKMLRDLVYYPICEGTLMRRLKTTSSYPGQYSPTRQAIGILGTFVASGLMHGLIIMYLCGEFGWKNALFFIVHGFAVLLERTAKETVGGASMVRRLMGTIPDWMFVLYTLGILHVTSHALFWPEVLGLSSQVVKSINVFESRGR